VQGGGAGIVIAGGGAGGVWKGWCGGACGGWRWWCYASPTRRSGHATVPRRPATSRRGSNASSRTATERALTHGLRNSARVRGRGHRVHDDGTAVGVLLVAHAFTAADFPLLELPEAALQAMVARRWPRRKRRVGEIVVAVTQPRRVRSCELRPTALARRRAPGLERPRIRIARRQQLARSHCAVEASSSVPRSPSGSGG
jgi:hypothetical protein